MSEKEFNQVFANNLIKYLELNDMSQNELARALDVSPTSVNNWCRGLKTPRMDKVDKICGLFRIERSDLINEPESEESSSKQSYYLDPEAAEMAQELYDRPEMRVLFDASRKATKEDIEQVADILKRLSGK